MVEPGDLRAELHRPLAIRRSGQEVRAERLERDLDLSLLVVRAIHEPQRALPKGGTNLEAIRQEMPRRELHAARGGLWRKRRRSAHDPTLPKAELRTLTHAICTQQQRGVQFESVRMGAVLFDRRLLRFIRGRADPFRASSVSIVEGQGASACERGFEVCHGACPGGWRRVSSTARDRGLDALLGVAPCGIHRRSSFSGQWVAFWPSGPMGE